MRRGVQKAHLLLRDGYTACGKERVAVRYVTPERGFVDCEKCMAATLDGDWVAATLEQFLDDAPAIHLRDVQELSLGSIVGPVKP